MPSNHKQVKITFADFTTQHEFDFMFIAFLFKCSLMFCDSDMGKGTFSSFTTEAVEGPVKEPC